jgi:uncharacterized OB-fold protein
MNGSLTPHYTAAREEFQPFFDSLTRGELAFPLCRACGKFQWYPMKVCKFCGHDDIEWRAVSGEARLFSWTVVRFRFGRHIPHELPYVVALVEFDDAPAVKFITNLVGVDISLLKEGLMLSPTIVVGKPPRVEFGLRLQGA